MELYTSPKQDIRKRAIKGILNLGPELPLEILLDLLDHIREVGNGFITEKRLKQCKAPALITEMLQRLKSPDEYIREIACTVLGELGDWAATPYLAVMLDDPHWWVRRAAGWALVKLKDPSSVDAILRRYQQNPKDDINVKMALQSALNELGVAYIRHPS